MNITNDTTDSETKQPLALATGKPEPEPEPRTAISIFDGPKFEHAQRVAKALSAASLVPKDFQGNIPNTLIALDMSDRLGASPMAVMQSIYIVHGRPSWSASFIIAMINTCHRFTGLQFELSGTGEDRQCIAWSRIRATGERVEGPPVSLRMARAEGWVNRPGSKWQTMAEAMLHYRSATFFGRIYTPELLLGMQSTEEIIDIEGADIGPPHKALHGPRLFATPKIPDPAQPGPVTATTIEPERPKRSRGRPRKPQDTGPVVPEPGPVLPDPAEPDAKPQEDEIPMASPEESNDEWIPDPTDAAAWKRNPNYRRPE